LTKGFTFFLVAAVSALPALGSSFYIGADTACFYGSSDTSCTLSDAETSIGVNLSGNPILFYTPDSGFNAPATGGSVELGSFSVADSLLGIEGGTFDLEITFSEPGGGGNTYTANTLGLVVLGQLGAEVTFEDPLSQVYSYPGGAFVVSLPSSPILIGAGDTVALDAVISPAPEPAWVGAIGSVLMLLVCIAVRRRSAKPSNV
jgi:hypothetical protein